MKLPEDIEISNILHFDQNYELAFDYSYPPSWEFEESLDIQEAIDEDWATLEKRYNEFAFAYNYNEYGVPEGRKEKDRVEDALLLARTTLYYSGLAGEDETPKVRSTGEQLLTRVVFSEIVDTLCRELPDVHSFEGTSHMDFVRITREAEMPYMFTGYQEDDGEY